MLTGVAMGVFAGVVTVSGYMRSIYLRQGLRAMSLSRSSVSICSTFLT